MPKKPFFDVSVKYDNPLLPNGVDWRTIGKAYQEADGKIIIKLGGLPLTGWDGTFVLFPVPRPTEK